MGDDEIIIDHIINSLRNFALNDIKKVIAADKNTVLASFILCSCFIEQVSGFRYGKVSHKTGKAMFEDFVKDYMPPHYNPKQLREDLRNKLVHNYSLGNTYSLVEKRADLHLTPLGNRIIINIENFLQELEEAFNKYINHLKQDNTIKEYALKWYEKHKILGMDNHDFYTYEQAEEIVNGNIKSIKGVSKLEWWPFNLKGLLIVPSGSAFETIHEICTHRVQKQIGSKEALINLSLFNNTKFDVFIAGVNDELQASYIKLSDYLEAIGQHS